MRALRDGGWGWLTVGLVAGIGLQNKTLVAFLLAGLAVGLLVAGPRAALRSPWPWAAAGIALVLWTPNLGGCFFSNIWVWLLTRGNAAGAAGTARRGWTSTRG